MTTEAEPAIGQPPGSPDSPEDQETMRKRLIVHLRSPLHRNGYALVASTFVTSALGALYWAIAARAYSSRDVGLNASLISTMMFLTNLASLNFSDVLNRFVPVSRGGSTRRLVLSSYAIAVVLGGVSATVFVLGARVWAPWLGGLLHGFGFGLVYVLATMLWIVFVLQDAVLVGLRRAMYTLFENTAFGVVKIVLLVILAAAVPGTGIFLSWTAPLLVVVIVVNVIVFGRLIPRHAAEPSSSDEMVDRGQIRRFLIADYVTALLWTASIAGMPVLVLKIDGARSSAYVFLAWTISYTLYLVSRNLGMSLTTEGAHDPGQLGVHVRSTLIASARIVVPLSLGLAIAAPWVLRIFGAEYATHGTALMRLLALSAIPAIVPMVYVSAARVQRRFAAMVAATACSSIPVLVLVPLLMGSLGISGVGAAWLIVQSAVALVLLPTVLFRPDWDVPIRADSNIELETPEKFEPPDELERRELAAARRLERYSKFRGAVGRWWPWATLLGGGGLWVLSLALIGSDPIGRYGLVSGLSVTYFTALALTVIGIVASIRRGSSVWLTVVHIVLLVLMIHATPALIYPELRYAWAWRHVGVVDLMARRHVLVPDTPVLPLYQHWPGFFAAATTLTEGAGLKSALSFASWSPPIFELLNAAALVVLFGALTQDRRRVTLAVVLFLAANWIGQDYFAPQALSYFFYLVLIGMVLRWYRRARPDEDRRTVPPISQRRTVALLVVLMMAATVISHPLTPIVACVSLTLLTAFRLLDRRWPLVLMTSFTAIWLVTGASAYTSKNLSALASGFGKLGNNVGSNLANLDELSREQNVVSTMGRGVVLLVAALAVAGLIRVTRHRRFEVVPALLACAPVAVLAAGSYGGEAVFRVYLFALPFAAFLAAGLFFPGLGVVPRRRTSIAILGVVAMLLVGLLFAYFGKEAWNRFTPDEARAAELVFSKAPPNSLLIDATGSYPTEFEHAERFTYVTLAAEPRRSMQTVLARPARVLETWMSDTRFARTYLILTRSQIAEANATGVMPRGSLERMRRALVASDRFTVLFESPDALVLTIEPVVTTSGVIP